MKRAVQKSTDDARKTVIDHMIKNSLYRDSRILRRFKGALNRSLGEEVALQQTKTSWEIIYYLCCIHFSESTCSVSDIFLSIGVSKTSVIRCISKLEKMNIVEKVPDPNDSRRRLITLTDAFAPIVTEFVDECMDLFDDLIVAGERKERTRTEAILRASEQRFRNIADSSSDWFWECDADFRFTYFSHRRNDFQEVSQHYKMEGLTLWEAVDAGPESDEIWDDYRNKLRAQVPFRDFRYTITLLSGRTQVIAVNGVPFFDDDGVFKGFRGAATDLTEATVAQRALKESEDRFSEFAYLSSNWLWEIDDEYRFTWISEDHSFKSPVIPEMKIGNVKFDTVLLETEEDQRIFENHRIIVDRRQPFRNFEHRSRAADGSVKWVSVNGIPIFDENHEFRGYRGAALDITQRKIAELERERIDSQFKQFAHLASDWFWEMDTDFRYSWISLERELVTGEAPESILGKTRWECALIENEEDQRLIDQHRNDMESERPYKDFEYKKPGRKNAVHWYTVSGTPYYDDDGTFLGYRGTARDVDERKKTEQSSQDRADLFSSILDNIPCSIFRLDKTSTFLGCNKEFSQMLGLNSKESVIGLKTSDLPWSPSEIENFRDKDVEVLEKGIHCNVIVRVEKLNGRTLKINKVPLRDSDGQITGLLGVCMDIP